MSSSSLRLNINIGVLLFLCGLVVGTPPGAVTIIFIGVVFHAFGLSEFWAILLAYLTAISAVTIPYLWLISRNWRAKIYYKSRPA